MIKLLSIIALFSFIAIAYGQTTIFSDDFEAGTGPWTLTGATSPNTWIFDNCAGNGTSNTGTSSMYISNGNASACGATGNEAFEYSNAASGSQEVISYVLVDASCRTGLELSFDYRIEGTASEDFGELVYSADGGGSWIPVGGHLPISAGWTNTTINLPTLLNNSTFFFGFRFTYNDATINGSPLSIDNLNLIGYDTVDPIITCPAVIPIYVDASCNGTIPDYTGLAVVSDNCSGTVTVSQSPVPGSTVDITSSPTITLTATDLAGNTAQCDFTQTIQDTVSPTISCPGNQAEYLNGSCTVTIPDFAGLVSTSDNCSAFGAVTVSQAPPPSAIIGADATITMTATDGSGNNATCQFTLQTIDTISPTITCPAPVTEGTTTACNYSLGDLTGMASATDNCMFGTFTYTQSPAPGTLLPIGAHSISITIEDEGGNTDVCSFNLTVEDQTPPSISTCAPNQNVIVDSNCEGVLADYSTLLNVTDNCSSNGNLVYTQVPPAGSPIFSDTIVTITVTDENNNSADCQFSALLSDTTAPTVNCPANLTLAINSSCEYTIPDLLGSVTGTDNCSMFGDMTLTQNPLPGTTGSGTTAVLITLIDEDANLSTCITTILPDDITAPTITCPAPITQNNGTHCDFVLPNYGTLAAVTDNCSGYTFTQSPAPGTLVNAGSHDITITVIDAGGNSDNCVFELTVLETTPPTITCPTNISTCDPIVSYAAPTYGDNCNAVSLLQTDLTGLSSGDTFPEGITTLEYTAIDSSGNTAVCSFDIEVLEYPSSANILDDTVALCNQNSAILNAEPLISGSGEWTVASGQGTFNNQFSASTGVNSIGLGTNVFYWTVSSPSCGSIMDSVVVINSLMDIDASTQDTVYSCNEGTVNLIANAPLYGTGTWTTSDLGIIADPNSANTTSTVIQNGWSEYVWTIENGGCPTTSDTLMVFAMKPPVVLQGDTSLCEGDVDLVLNGLASIPAHNASWEVLSGVIDFTGSSTITINHIGSGTNVIAYTFNNPECPTVGDTVTIIGTFCENFNPVIPTVITPFNLDGKNDVLAIDYLDILYPDCHVVIFNRWGSVVYESTGYAEPWDGRHKGEFLPMGTYFYRIELMDSENTVLTGDVNIIH